MTEQNLEIINRPPRTKVTEFNVTVDGAPLNPIGQAIDPVADCQTRNDSWQKISSEAVIKFGGKHMGFNEICAYVKSTCSIPTFPNLDHIKSLEEKIGNLISEIYIEKARANFALIKLDNQRMRRLGSFVSDKGQKSISAIEARLSATDKAFQSIAALLIDCKATYEFWTDMYNICLRATDRLKQISMALMAEMKLDPSNTGGRGERVHG